MVSHTAPAEPQRFCKSCNELALPGRTRCAKHREYQVNYNRTQRLLRRSAGLCFGCSAPTPHQFCEACKARYRANRARKAQEVTK